MPPTPPCQPPQGRIELTGLETSDSGIEDVAGLEGARFAVSTLNNLAEATIRTTLRNEGVDDSGIDFVELGFPDMNGALEAGEVDAAWQAEPFVTLGENAGLVNVVDPMHATMPSMPIAGMFAYDQWLADNPDRPGQREHRTRPTSSPRSARWRPSTGSSTPSRTWTSSSGPAADHAPPQWVCRPVGVLPLVGTLDVADPAQTSTGSSIPEWTS